MSNTSHPLNNAFDIDDGPDTDMMFEDMDMVEIPEIKNLDFVIERALADYAEIKNSMHLVEGKYRLEYMMLARDFLSQAKDAMNKKELLILKAKTVKVTPNNAENTGSDKTTERPKTITREELEATMKLVGT